MKQVSAIIVVKNNPQHLFEALKSIDDLASEIIIGNINIGKDYMNRLKKSEKVKIVELASEVPYADLVKESLKKQAKGEYILYLDPDEIFPNKIKEFLLKNLEKFDYYLFPRKNIIFGKWIQHSRWWPDYQLRLLKKNTVTWPKKLHPAPIGVGKEYKFEALEENALLHYNYDTIDQYLEKATRYAKSEATSLTAGKKTYTLPQALQKALSEFISRYFAYDGYKDGIHGFVLAILQMFYYFLVYFYYWEKKKYGNIEKNTQQNFQNFTRNLLFETNFWFIKKNLVSASKKIKLKIQNKVLKLFGN